MLSQGAQEVQRRARPEWVIPAEFEVPESIEEGSGSGRYLVADIQRHLEEEVSYQYYVLSIANEAGVEDNSQQSFDFQPEYETWVLHQIEVWRDGVAQNRLADANRLRRELADNSREKMEETYRDFYAKDFPGLEVASPLAYVDDGRVVGVAGVLDGLGDLGLDGRGRPMCVVEGFRLFRSHRPCRL